MTEMTYSPLGHSGLMVSAVGLGCNNFGRAGSRTETQEGTTAVVEAALDAGVNFLDTADMYGREPGLSETLLGNALRGRRADVVLATKFGHADFEAGIPSWGAKGSRRYVRLAVEASLRRLQTEWIDLYQLHTPDPITPIEETLAALNELIDEGKVRYIGHSNFAGWQVAEAEFMAREAGGARFISAQNEYNLLTRGAERELLPAVNAYGLGFLPWFPLYNGLFTGKFGRAGGPSDTRIMRQRPHLLENAPWETIETYQRFCADRGITMLQATFEWLLSRPGLSSVIAGATTPEQIRQNVAEGASTSLTPAEHTYISELFTAS
ncbi:aldo/keto reductase [Mycetocola spongiae]|uniref:aldo/keto reductase n=1 Tax=Mycetocola spongiae TaxID=2859226 RepID=UPI001CF1060F|nr:aldo/keto reductase [Mycetocola spongiae]UCR90134.1 aldo/keto reductase [Mycetocola spongiae]